MPFAEIKFWIWLKGEVHKHSERLDEK